MQTHEWFAECFTAPGKLQKDYSVPFLIKLNNSYTSP
ncbi:hypothetical protein IMCC3135_01360 [Granulosicoccus antarcticus IMCC3135]|uniref:Uncharacterized protein n=1 Tax=Granulosicoccus antarcticus IMCC3135 TaxID=1192854 RepID=A0A2Z2NJY9_9GAMM|nr:hypothetical protein IMCC3135_01360 [Granulosicoccus antarcticus IMCC3135]